MATAAEKEALGLEASATEAEVMARITALATPIEGQAASLAFKPPVDILVIWSVSGREFRRGTYVIPAQGALVLDESKMDAIDLAELDTDAGVGKVRTSDPLTPVSDIQRYARSPRAAVVTT